MRGSIDKRGDRTYRIRLSLGYDGGKRITLTETYHGTRKEAEARLRDLIAEYDRGHVTKRSRISLNDFLEQWFKTVKTKIRQRTFDDYQGVADRYLKEGLGRLPLTSLTPLGVQKIYQELQDRGLSAQTVRRLHTVLNQALRQGVKWKMLSYNPASDVELPRAKRNRVIRAMTAGQALLFVKACKGHRWEMVLIFALDTGMRPEEYLALQWEDIDWDKGFAMVNKALVRPKGGGWKFEEPKTESSRRAVDLDDKLLQDLRAHRTRQLQERLFAGPRWDTSHNFVFTNDEGGPISATNLLLRGFKRVLEAAGLASTFRLYDLRHTHATMLLQSGENIKVVSDRLGHAGVSITLDTYSHVLPDMRRGAASSARARIGH